MSFLPVYLDASAIVKLVVPEPETDALLDALAADIAPIDDIRSTARYRQRVAGHLLAECLRSFAASRPGS